MERVATRWWLAVALAACALATCGGDWYFSSTPGIATDGKRYTLAWIGPSWRGVPTIYTQQFDADGAPRGDRAVVFRGPELRQGATIVRTATGYLALGEYHPPGSEYESKHLMLAAPLDDAGRPRGEPVLRYFSDRLCGSPVHDGREVLVAAVSHASDPRFPDDLLMLHFLDDSGHGGAVAVAAGHVGSCATATDGKDAVTAYTVRGRSSDKEWLILRFGRDREEHVLSLRIPQNARGGLAIVPIHGEWGVMYGLSDAVTVMRVSRRGVETATTIPGVDPGSASLAVTPLGLVVSWQAGGKVNVIAESRWRDARAQPAGPRPSGTSVLGLRGLGCVVAWSNRNGRTPRLGVFPDCP